MVMASSRADESGEEASDNVMSRDPSQQVCPPDAGSPAENVSPTSQLSAEEPVDGMVRTRMVAQRRRDTLPETELRRELHRRGLRFRVDHPLPVIPRRRADILFPRARLAVFVDGCFWHDCPVHGTRPKVRAQWWVEKLRRNVERDRDTDRRLVEAGWSVLRFWEHDEVPSSADEVEAVYRSRVEKYE